MCGMRSIGQDMRLRTVTELPQHQRHYYYGPVGVLAHKLSRSLAVPPLALNVYICSWFRCGCRSNCQSRLLPNATQAGSHAERMDCPDTIPESPRTRVKGDRDGPGASRSVSSLAKPQRCQSLIVASHLPMIGARRTSRGWR